MTEEELQSLDSMKLEEQIKFQEPTKKVMMIFQESILDALMVASIQESMIQELAIQVSMIQESKMQAPTILMVLESNEVLRI